MEALTNKKVLHIIEQMSMDEKLLCTHGQIWDPYRANQAGFVRGIKRLGIPDVFIADGESGVNVSWETTAFPAKVGLAATFDKTSAYEYGRALGKEAKAAGIHVTLTPRVNIVRDPVSIKGTSNGGNYQTYGEDPILNGKMGAREAEGIQEDHRAIANLKQMFGSSTGSAQGAGNCMIDQQTIHELYLKPFELVMRAGVASGMTNYNQVNGTWTYDYPELTSYARGQWGFQGFIFDDWYCLFDPNAIRHGATLEMPGSDYYDEGSDLSCYGKALSDAVYDPSQPVTLEDLDRAVYYYLDTLDRFGMLDEEQRIPGPIDTETKEESIEVCHSVAEKGAVLLKNEDNILPFDFKDKKVGIIGPGGAHQVMATFKEASYGFADRKSSVFSLLHQKYGENIAYCPGINLDGVVIPSSCLKPYEGAKESGLKQYVGPFTYETLSNGDLEHYEQPDQYTIDAEINHVGDSALPLLKEEQKKGFIKETPKSYYMWSGFLCPKETGMYRINMQSKFPGVREFEENNVQNSDQYISTSGNLYIRKKPENDNLERIGIGTRIFSNGTTDPYSEVVPCEDGWNNAGGYVYLEAGKEYEIYFNHTCISLEPLEIRLAWTTPSMALKAKEEALELAKQSDVVLYFAWHQSVNDSMKLDGNQDALIYETAKVNENTIVILNNGDPVEMPWRDEVKAILEMWFSGQEGARATLDILEGKVNPAGRLPVTFPVKLEDLAARDPNHPERYAPSGRINEKDAVHPNTVHFTEGLLNGYRWFDEEDIEPMYPFGYGMSYTTFSYSKPDIKPSGAGYLISCEIKNTGRYDGEEVAQCYLCRPSEVPKGVQCAPKVLVDFTRVFIKAGETKQVSFKLEERDLQYYDSNKKSYKKFIGKREILIGASSRDIRLKDSVFEKQG